MLKFLRNLIATKSISSATVMGAQPVRWSARNARAFSAEGYQRCVVVFRCVDLIAQSVASIPIYVNEEENHPIAQLLKRPNPMMSYDDLIGWLVGFHRITGNSYLEAVSVGRMPRELWPYLPYSMKVVEPERSNALIPQAYLYDDGVAGNKREWPVDALTGASELMHWKTFDPCNRWYGLSPLAAAAMAVDQHNEANVWNMKLLQNNAVPSGALVTQGTISDANYKRLKADIEEGYQGSQNARRPLLLEGGMDWKQFALTPAEMDFLNGKLMSAQDICGAYGVPAQLIPLPGSQTFANFEQARLALWQDTVIPLAQNMMEKLGRWFTVLTGAEVNITLDLDEIPALEPVRATKWASVGSATFLTINEKREALGYEVTKLEGADTVFVAGGQIPLTTKAESDAALANDNIQQTALNGTQISSLITIVQEVGIGSITPDSARAIISAAFPTLDAALVDSMLASVKPGSQKPAPVAAPGGPKKPVDDPEDDGLGDAKALVADLLRAGRKSL
jgi:HK97 family phage portal protein